VLWVNDSASTTPDATINALDAFDRPAVVILGGVGKGADFTELARAVTTRARATVLIGTAADEIAGALEAAGGASAGLVIERARTLEDAVSASRRLARPGDVVLLSPACASFDMFSSADERGDRFTALVRSFTEPVHS
jgi:UDP-N-acetylmuramoylalanine--D-glutamate ligase